MELSVVIPAYNREWSLRGTIDSALACGVEAEIIVVDDGSTDRTVEVARSYGGQVAVLQQANAGPAAARNTGFAHATGSIISFLDSDDIWQPGVVPDCLKALRDHTDIDVLVPAGRQSAERLKRALMLLPDKAAEALDPRWFDEGENIRVADAFVVDIMLNACGQTYETLKPYAETVDLDGVPVKTVNLEGLLLTKRTNRDKDISDRIVLEKALEVLRKRLPASD